MITDFWLGVFESVFEPIDTQDKNGWETLV